MIHGCLRGIHVLGLGVIDDAAAKAHHLAPMVEDGQHQAIAELIVKPAIFIGDNQARRQKFLLTISPPRHLLQKPIPRVGGSAHTEVHRHLAGNPPLFQIVADSLALLGQQHFVVPPRRFLVQLQQALALPLGTLVAAVALWHFHARPLGEELHRLGEGQVFHLHNEVDDPAALMAAEAVINLLARIDGERGRLFIVERTQAKLIAALRC